MMTSLLAAAETARIYIGLADRQPWAGGDLSGVTLYTVSQSQLISGDLRRVQSDVTEPN